MRYVLRLVLLLLVAQEASATVFTIGDGDVSGLKAAMATANSNNQDDTINLAVNSTYSLIAFDNGDVGANGLPVILPDSGHSLTINGNGATISCSTGHVLRLLKIATGSQVTITALTLTNGFADTTGGGAIYNEGNLTMQNCSVLSNFTFPGSTARGAGIYNANGTLTLLQCLVSGNQANAENATSGGDGGGIYVFGNSTVSLDSCTFSGNNATLNNGSVTQPGGRGGAVAIEGGTATLRNCTFSANSSSGPFTGGGAIHNAATLTVTNSTFSGNSAPQANGGAISALSLSITNCTISGNSAMQGGGLENKGAENKVSIENTIIAGNTGSTNDPDVVAPSGITSLGHNLIGAIDGSSGWVNSDLTGTAASPRQAQLGPLQNNGGPTETMALQPTSPAIDGGDDAVLGLPLNLTADQRGYLRKMGTHVDIGAYEVDPPQAGPTFIVNVNSDHNDNACGVNDCSLREAIAAANSATGANTVQFAPGVTGTIALTLGELVISDALTIQGPGANILVIDAQLASRVLRTNAPGVAISVSGLTLSNGRIEGNGSPGQGGCIYNDATLTLASCAVTGGTASGGLNSTSEAGQGGGIYNANANALTLTGCTVSGNSAVGGIQGRLGFTGGDAFGGGIYIGQDANGNSSTLNLHNCTFSANVAQGASGGHASSTKGGDGGNAHGGAIEDAGLVNIASCTFTANSALGGPGGTGNTNGLHGTGNGGGLALVSNSGNLIIGGTIVAGNTADADPDVFGTFGSHGFNLIGNAEGSAGFTASGDKVGTNNSPIDPKLGPLAGNGGPTKTHALLPGSPAIDASNTLLTTDQRGMARPFDDPSTANASGSNASDIGAFELQPAPTPTPTATPTATPGSLGNVSTRLQIGTGNNVLFAGFIIQGSGSKTVLIRSIGPSLTGFGVPGAMSDPKLELHDANNLIGTNDNWQTTQLGGVITSDQVAAIQNSGVKPNDPAEPAIIATLPAGQYSAIVDGVGSTQGVATVELYDLSPNNGATLANISTRGFIQTGDNVMIGGFIIGGQSLKVIVVAVGPSLAPFGINNALTNPQLELHDANGTLGGNDNWQTTQLGGIITSDQSAEIQSSGLAPSDPAESAIIVTLPPGNYTAIAQGVGSEVGVGVIQVFALP